MIIIESVCNLKYETRMIKTIISFISLFGIGTFYLNFGLYSFFVVKSLYKNIKNEVLHKLSSQHSNWFSSTDNMNPSAIIDYVNVTTSYETSGVDSALNYYNQRKSKDSTMNLWPSLKQIELETMAIK